MFPFLAKSSCLAGAALLLLAARGQAQTAPAPFALHDGDRVVFYGDSITDQRLYTTVFTRRLCRDALSEPIATSDFHPLGLGRRHACTGGGGGPIDHANDSAMCFAYRPTVMTIMLGMNDASYRAFDQGIVRHVHPGLRPTS